MRIEITPKRLTKQEFEKAARLPNHLPGHRDERAPLEKKKHELKKHGFTKDDRILKRTEFLRLSKNGKKVHTRYFLAIFEEGPENRSRLGITVTKKCGCAVQRNRIKRIIREYFRLNRSRITRYLNISLIVKVNAAKLDSKKLFSALHDVIQKINRHVSY